MTATVLGVRPRDVPATGGLRFQVDLQPAGKRRVFEAYTFDVELAQVLRDQMHPPQVVHLVTRETRYGVEILSMEAA